MSTTSTSISLFDCMNAIVDYDRLRCKAGHPLHNQGDGSLDAIRVRRGAPLRYSLCQECMDWKPFTPPDDCPTFLPDDEKGWKGY